MSPSLASHPSVLSVFSSLSSSSHLQTDFNCCISCTSYYMCMITNSFVYNYNGAPGYSYYNIYHGHVCKILACDLYDTQLGMVTMGVGAHAQCLLCLSSNIMGPPLTLLGSYTCVANACRVCGVFTTFLCRVG